MVLEALEELHWFKPNQTPGLGDSWRTHRPTPTPPSTVGVSGCHWCGDGVDPTKSNVPALQPLEPCTIAPQATFQVLEMDGTRLDLTLGQKNHPTGMPLWHREFYPVFQLGESSRMTASHMKSIHPTAPKGCPQPPLISSNV